MRLSRRIFKKRNEKEIKLKPKFLRAFFKKNVPADFSTGTLFDFL